jgi:glutamate racemase
MSAGPRGPIGVFDSGIGGLTVYRALRRVLPPDERLVYLGDTARVPYGTRSDATVVRYALEGGRFLARHGAKAIVVACNTMSAVALDALAADAGRPVVGVIEPGAAAACAATRGGTVGVIGTAATVKSGAYPRAIERLRPGTMVLARACPMFVPLAEEGWVDNEVARASARLYLGDLGGAGLDVMVLGCTHYPLLTGVIGEALGAGVRLVDSAEATAAALSARLAAEGLFAPGAPAGAPPPAAGADPGADDHFYVTDSSERFHEVGSRFLGRRLGRLEQVDLSE